jgi:hypothetical protein
MRIRFPPIYRFHTVGITPILCLFFLAAPCGLLAQDYFLLSVMKAGAPAIKNRDLIFKTNLRFRKAPENFWIHYDAGRKALAIDIYGGTIDTQSLVVVGTNEVFKEIEIRNQTTTMSLSGKQALIYLKAEPGWHFEAASISKTTIQITSWKEMPTPKPDIAIRKGRRVFLYSLAFLGAAAVTFFLILIIAGNDSD